MPVDGWLHGYRVELLDARGRVLPQRLLHHVNLIVPTRRELFSPIMLRLGASGAETAPVSLPRPLGYRVRRGDSLVVSAMLHNPDTVAYEGVRLRVRLPYTTAPAWRRLAVFPFYLDVMPPAGLHAYDLPPGRSERSWEGRPAVAGRILAVGGHLHRYAVALRFEDVTAGRVLWEVAPRLDARGEVVGVPTKSFLWRLGLPLRADHVYRLSAVYDNPTGRLIPDGGMGALGGVVVPARGAAWPRVARTHPEYVRDLQVTYRTGGPAAGAPPAHDAHAHHARPVPAAPAAPTPPAPAPRRAGVPGAVAVP
jgi:hypothetical protein